MVLKTIDREAYEHEVLVSSRPTLLCFMKNTVPRDEDVLSLGELSRQFAAMDFCRVQEEDFDFFGDTLHFLGTPIFIMLLKGKEQGRLMGTVSLDRLRAFVEKNGREH